MQATITPKQVKALRKRYKLTQAELGYLCRLYISKHPNRGPQSRSVAYWEAGTQEMPALTYELLKTKLVLLSTGEFSLSTLIDRPLFAIVRKLIQDAKKH